jgi:translocator protein
MIFTQVAQRPKSHGMRKVLSAILFVVACVAIGALSGLANTPGEWYQSLEKPFFNPPDWIFAPVWAGIYILIGLALAETWFDEDSGRNRRLFVFGIQAVLNLLWSPSFFGLQMPILGLLVIVPLLASILVFIAISWQPDRKAALLFVPYALWVAFATLLNLSIVMFN